MQRHREQDDSTGSAFFSCLILSVVMKFLLRCVKHFYRKKWILLSEWCWCWKQPGLLFCWEHFPRLWCCASGDHSTSSITTASLPGAGDLGQNLGQNLWRVTSLDSASWVLYQSCSSLQRKVTEHIMLCHILLCQSTEIWSWVSLQQRLLHCCVLDVAQWEENLYRELSTVGNNLQADVFPSSAGDGSAGIPIVQHGTVRNETQPGFVFVIVLLPQSQIRLWCFLYTTSHLLLFEPGSIDRMTFKKQKNCSPSTWDWRVLDSSSAVESILLLLNHWYIYSVGYLHHQTFWHQSERNPGLLNRGVIFDKVSPTQISSLKLCKVCSVREKGIKKRIKSLI